MKKRGAVLCLAAIMLVCASCAREARFGIWELERRLKETNVAYAFDTESMFRKEGVYHVFYRTENGTLLLKAEEDGQRRLRGISLTATETDRASAGAFCALAGTLADLFLPEEARTEAHAALGLDDPGRLFADETLTFSCGRYEAELFKSAKGSSLLLRYKPLPATEGEGTSASP